MGAASKAWVALRMLTRPDWLWLGGAFVLFGAAHATGWWSLGAMGALVYLWGLCRVFTTICWLGPSALARVCLGLFGLFGVWLLALDTWYLLVGSITPWVTFVATSAISIGATVLKCPTHTESVLIERQASWIWALVSVVASVALLGLFCLARTYESVVSPWNLFGWQPFLLFATALLSAMACSWEREDDVPIFVWMLVVFAGVSVSAIIYGVGFGFDPFLHRAAEEAMAQTGVVNPVRILYSGQYVAVAALHWLTVFPIRLVDTWFVPVLSAVWLPLIATLGFEHGWGVPRRLARTWWVLMLSIPFMLATFTVPFTITYVAVLGGLVAFPWFWRLEQRAWLMVCVGYVALVCVHPLVILPFLLFLVGGRWARGHVLRWGVVASLIAISVPFMVAVNQGVGITVGNIWEHRQAFFHLFRSPYWDPYPYIPWYLQALYAWRYWFPMLVSVGVAVVCAWKWRAVHAKAYFFFAVGLLGTIGATSTLFVLPGIIAHEQGEFALRLLQVLYVFALPFFSYGIMRVSLGMRVAHLWIGACATSALVVASWFFSYPQYNMKYPFYSPSVGRGDIALVHRIQEESGGISHVVLSHQMLSAAAIQEFGFAHTYRFGDESVLWYAVPTGGSLYALYTRTIYHGPSRDAYQHMAQALGVKRVYFVADSYWVYADWLVKALTKESDGIFQHDESKVYWFDFP